jgi:hypothetical protein
VSTTSAASLDPDRVVAGSDRIASAALVHTVQAAAAEALRVAYRDTRARVSDDGAGGLALDVTSPLAVPVLGSGRVSDVPVVQSAHAARAEIADRVRSITGRQVARVTVVYDSSVVERPPRVR